MNDGKCDRSGRFWAGTMANDLTPGAGSLYRLDPDLRVTRVLDGVGCSNGLAWSNDDSTMYYIDTVAGGVDAFDFESETETGEVANRRRLITRRYSPEGDLDVVVELQGRKPRELMHSAPTPCATWHVAGALAPASTRGRLEVRE